MSFEYGGEQRNSALDKLKQRAPSLTDQHPNVLYTMPMQTVEQLESVLRSTLALQENIRWRRWRFWWMRCGRRSGIWKSADSGA